MIDAYSHSVSACQGQINIDRNGFSDYNLNGVKYGWSESAESDSHAISSRRQERHAEVAFIISCNLPFSSGGLAADGYVCRDYESAPLIFDCSGNAARGLTLSGGG